MRISDWSSDVCSSDLHTKDRIAPREAQLGKGIARGDGEQQRKTGRKRRDEDAVEQEAPDAEGAEQQPVIFEAGARGPQRRRELRRSEEHTSELKSLMRIAYAVICLKKKNEET